VLTNKPFENVAALKYLEISVFLRNKINIQEEIKRRLI
jgi:hypothetical protein